MDWNQIIAILLENLVPAVLAMLSAALLAYLKRQGAQRETQALVEEAYTLLEGCVLYVNQVYVDAIRQTSGKLTEAQRAQANALCIGKFNEVAGDAIRLAVAAMYRSSEKWLETMLEADVWSAKEPSAAQAALPAVQAVDAAGGCEPAR